MNNGFRDDVQVKNLRNQGNDSTFPIHTTNRAICVAVRCEGGENLMLHSNALKRFLHLRKRAVYLLDRNNGVRGCHPLKKGKPSRLHCRYMVK